MICIKKTKLIVMISVLAGFGLSQLAYSEELPKAEKRTNVEYQEAVYVKYKAGKRREAFTIINKYFKPAGEAAGVSPPYAVHLQSGSWDAIFVWVLKGGMGDLDWGTSPDDAKWMAALAQQNGGMDKARAILDSYFALVAKTRREFGHHHLEPEKK